MFEIKISEIGHSFHLLFLPQPYVFHFHFNYKAQDSIGNPVPIATSSIDINVVHCTYVPQSTLPHTIEVNYGTVAAADSPYRVYVSTPPDVSKVVVSGKWFDEKPKLNNRTSFQIDTRAFDEYPPDVNVKITHDELAQMIPIEMKLDKNGVHHIEFSPSEPGHYSTVICCGGILLPHSRSVFVAPIVDLSKITIANQSTGPSFVGHLMEFTINFNNMTSAINHNLLVINIIDPNGNNIASKLTVDEDQDACISYTPKHAGCYKVDILYDNVRIPGSPFNINVKKLCEPKNCKAFGDGLISGTTGDVCAFDIETSDAGLGGLTLAIEGPAETKLKCVDNKNGSCSVQYIPTEPGDYEISILFANTHIPGSPFKVAVLSPVRPDKVRIFGPAITNQQIKVGEPTFFNIDVSEAGPGLIAVILSNVHGIPVDNVMVVNKGGGLYTVNFIPPAENIIVNVKFAHQNVASRYL